MSCLICSKKYTLDEVLKMSDKDIDDTLCQTHLTELFNRL